jgi:hypothetical protein
VIGVFTLHNARPGDPCFITGAIDISAGMTKVKSPSEIKLPSSFFEFEKPTELESDRWTKAVLYTLIPEVLTGIAIGNLTRTIPRWKNLDTYIATVMQISYSVTWDVFSSFIS